MCYTDGQKNKYLVLFSSEYFQYKIFITKNDYETEMTNSRRTSQGQV
jgi:hypothetical protein